MRHKSDLNVRQTCLLMSWLVHKLFEPFLIHDKLARFIVKTDIRLGGGRGGVCVCVLNWKQGSLTEGEGSVQLTSSLR